MTDPIEVLGSPRVRRSRPGAAARLALALLAGAVITIPAAFAAAEPEYDFILIEAFDPDDDLDQVMLRDINEANVVSGTATGSAYAGFYWSPATGKVTVPLTWPLGLNNAGQVVSEGIVYDLGDATTTVVPPAGGWPITRLQAINDDGIAVGYSECRCSNSGRTVQSAMVWDATLGSRAIPVENAKELLRINAAGASVGNIRGGTSASEGFFYQVHSGEHRNLSDLLPPNGFVRAYSELQDISDLGVMCGRGWDGTRVRGLTWSLAHGVAYIPPIPGGMIDRVYPRGINAAGVVVGFNDVTPYAPRAFVWDSEHGTRDLEDLVEAPPGFVLDWALKINDAGWIVGVGHYGPDWGASRGFVLKPRSDATADAPGATIASRRLVVVGNPVRERLAVSFTLDRADVARVTVFDLAGRRVATLLEAAMETGTHQRSWSLPADMSPGVYLVRLDTRGGVRAVERFAALR